MKQDILALYIKHDANFQTLTSISLGELIVKIAYFNPKGVSLDQLFSEVSQIINGKIERKNIVDALGQLKTKFHIENGKYFLNGQQKLEIEKALSESKKLHERVIDLYFSSAETDKSIVEQWFRDVTIDFFEKYNFELFYTTVHRSKKKTDNGYSDIEKLVESSFENHNILEKDRIWLTSQYVKFINESNNDSDLLFWEYGLASFSARLITASNYANKINIDAIKGTTFLLDTNVLMILNLEAHQLNNSIIQLEKVLDELGVKFGYLYQTKEEYRRAIAWKKGELASVFEEFNDAVLYGSVCPFIRTALGRGCRQKSDIFTLFEQLESIPNKFKEIIDVSIIDDTGVNDAVEKGRDDISIKNKINAIYKRHKNRDKRDAALLHDTGLIAGVKYLRTEGKYMILTNDSILKIYSSENPIRDEIGIAMGLDVLIKILAISGGNNQANPVNYAPLFKTLIKSSLVPSRESFHVEDLSFLLQTHLEIEKLPNKKIIELAKIVNSKLLDGTSEKDVELLLRREIERNRLSASDNSVERDMAINQRDEAVELNKTMAQNYVAKRTKELEDNFKQRRCWYRLGFIIVVVCVGLLEYWIITGTTSKLITEGLTLLMFAISYIPFNGKLARRKTQEREDIKKIISDELSEMKKQ